MGLGREKLHKLNDEFLGFLFLYEKGHNIHALQFWKPFVCIHMSGLVCMFAIRHVAFEQCAQAKGLAHMMMPSFQVAKV